MCQGDLKYTCEDISPDVFRASSFTLLFLMSAVITISTWSRGVIFFLL